MPALFCPICGGPLRGPAAPRALPLPRELQWQVRAVLFYDPAHEFETREEHYRGGKRKAAPPLEFRRKGRGRRRRCGGSPDRDAGESGLDDDTDDADDAGNDDDDDGGGIRWVRAVYSTANVDNQFDLFSRYFLLEQQQPPLQEQDGASEAIRGDSEDRTQASGTFAGPAVRVHAHRGRGPDGGWQDSAPPYYIAVHEACADIARRVAAARPPRPGVRVRSLETLWKVLRTRFDARDSERRADTGPRRSPRPPFARVPMSHAYHMPLPLADEKFLLAAGECYYQHWVSKQASARATVVA